MTTQEKIDVQEPAPTVQAAPTLEPQSNETGAQEPAPTVQAALPTAVTIPPTPVPPTPTPDRTKPSTYVVQSGDVLSVIAERFDVDIKDLRAANNLSGNLIKVGQTLTIPAIGAPAGTTQTETAAPAPKPAATSAPRGPVTCSAGAVGHCTQPGDTLYGLASKYGVSVEAIRAANPSIVGNTIVAGAVYTIPGANTPTSPAPANPAPTNPVAPVATTAPTQSVPRSDADCKAANANYPYFHAEDGKCYANPIAPGGATPTPTSSVVKLCAEGWILHNNQCWPGSTPTVSVTAVPSPTPTATTLTDEAKKALPNNELYPAPCLEGDPLVNNNQCVRTK